MKKLRKNENIEVRDRGDSSIISLVIALPLVLAILFTIIDSGIYFMNSQIINSEANNGARIVAIYGGNGDAGEMTQIEAAYTTADEKLACQGVSTSFARTPTECGIFRVLTESKMLTGVKINNVLCTPVRSLSIGADVSCTVDWEYSGIPGSAMSFISIPEEDGSRRSPFRHTETKGTAKSEVMLDTTHMVPRSR